MESRRHRERRRGERGCRPVAGRDERLRRAQRDCTAAQDANRRGSSRANDRAGPKRHVVPAAQHVVENVSGDEDVADRVLDLLRRLLSDAHVRVEVLRGRRERKFLAAGNLQRFEKDVDAAVNVTAMRGGGLDDLNLHRRSLGRNGDAVQDDWVLQMRARTRSRTRTRTDRLVENEKEARFEWEDC